MNLSKCQLDKLRGYKLDDEDVKYVIDVFGPVLAEHGIHFCKNINPSADEHIDGESMVVAQMADNLIQHKCEINNTLRLKKPYYTYILAEDCNDSKDAIFIAKNAFQLAGWNPDDYNITADYDKYNDMYVVNITVK